MGLRYSRMSTRAKPKCFCFHRPVNSVLPTSPLAPGGSAMRKYWVAFGWLSLCVCMVVRPWCGSQEMRGGGYGKCEEHCGLAAADSVADDWWSCVFVVVAGSRLLSVPLSMFTHSFLSRHPHQLNQHDKSLRITSVVSPLSFLLPFPYPCLSKAFVFSFRCWEWLICEFWGHMYTHNPTLCLSVKYPSLPAWHQFSGLPPGIWVGRGASLLVWKTSIRTV